MIGTTQRSRRSTVGLSNMWKCMLGLCLLLDAALARAHERFASPQDNEHARKAQATESGENSPYKNEYCGTSWQDAYQNCGLACPGGEDSECSSLGDEYTCHSWTACHERNNVPTDSSEAISFPECPPEYLSGVDYNYTRGELVAHSIAGNSEKDVYGCQGDNCSAAPPGPDNTNLSWKLVGSCNAQGSETTGASDGTSESAQGSDTTGTSSAPKWWLDGSSQCVYSGDYPPSFMTVPKLTEQFIFESNEECCASKPEACNPTNTTPTGQPTISASAATRDFEPTSSPTEDSTSYIPTASSSFIHGQNILLSVTTIFIVLLF